MPAPYNSISELIVKTLNEEDLTPAEQQAFDQALQGPGSKEALYNDLKDMKKLAASMALIYTVDLAHYRNRINAMEAPTATMRRKQPAIRQYLVAAGIMILLSLATWYLFVNRPSPTTHAEQQPIPSNPDDQESFIQLSDGSKLLLARLQNGTVNEGGTKITKQGNELTYYPASSAEEQPVYHRIFVRSTEKYILVLSDSSRILVNAATAVRYPVVFTGPERTVTMSGEAYFEVKKAPGHPFKAIVVANALDTSQQPRSEVLVKGTHFNIKAYANEPRQTITVDQGELSAYNKTDSLNLQAGDQAITEGQQKMYKTRPAHPEEAGAWKDGLFKLGDTDIRTIMRAIERRYDVKVFYTGAVPDRKISLYAKQSKPLEEILAMLKTYGVTFTVKGKEVYVSATTTHP